MVYSAPRRAFTLIELLVVIAIIGVLIALLLPAVQKVREAANRSQCQNNLKQMGVALHSYHSAANRFPPASVTTAGTGGNCCGPYGSPNISGLYYLLPYLEQDNLYKKFDYVNGTQVCNTGASPYWSGVTANNGVAAGTDVKTFLCPSDPNVLVQITGACAMNYYAIGEKVGGTNYVFSGGTGSSFDYIGSLAAGNLNPDLGGIFLANGKLGIRDITDGTSNTLAMGEVLWVDHDHNPPGNGTGGKPAWSVGFVTQIAFTTGGGINATWPCMGPNTTVAQATCGGPRNAALQSKHPAGANVMLADGSIRFISQNVAQSTLDSLATRANGEVIATDF